MLRIARLMAAKDLRVEARSRVVTNQVLPFAAIVMVMFAFALNSDAVVTRVAPGLVWLATLFSLLILVQRSFAIESADGATEALRAAGVDPAGIYLGKALALAVQLAVLEIVLLGSAVVLYRTELRLGGVALLIATYLADLRARLGRYALRRPCWRCSWTGDVAPAPLAPGGGAGADWCHTRNGSCAGHRWRKGGGWLALGGSAGGLRCAVRRRWHACVRAADRGMRDAELRK